ncbi:DUF1272 domain-containing protein [Kordiimonas aquimaris]|uniref:DUF1272 domain-containing protein n=1 Tax=Kordiimonas aquimaris TaxID=707591 RepID=UPI0021D3A4DA|nr:DUF1272 domain-containing protein [Kordiimonas aquimaris]
MLKIKSSCEHCNVPLPNGDANAMICSYECTFCKDCVEDVLHKVCPNCGGGFVPRPARVNREWRSGVSAAHQCPSSEHVHKPVDVDAHRLFAAKVNEIKLSER